ncbi:MAG: hypothetical protein AB8G95_24260 [Anaerolineae bacterium]
MKKINLTLILASLSFLLLLSACGGAPAEVEVAEIPTLAATVPLPLPATNVPPTLAATNTPQPQAPTATATVTNTPAPTETPVVNFAATDTATPTRLPGVLPSKTPTEIAPMNTGVGFQGEIGNSEFKVHIVEARQDQTVFAAVRVKPEVDAGLLIFEGNVANIAREEGVAVQDLLTSNKADREANFSGQGFMEVIAYTPKEDGEVSIVVTSSADSDGLYRLYVFDQTTASPNIVYNQTVQLDGGQTTPIGVTSNGGKPIVAFINPLDAAVDGKIAIKNSGGSIVTEANYAGGGSYETSFVLPLTTTGFSVEMTNVSGTTGFFEILVLAIQDPF